ncbi:ejaculatory bulb-specific protein 3-like [Pectinophora gossypiella]|uniref:ejaculatory bulb-specific protein 3-like n=1 Tax=Pectinophora gossypiella TaxID=13191 RepID=UPI00214F41F4|nr:ejaculatory bulb-specific protein 3-like [Pectinophora gossypiella]
MHRVFVITTCVLAIVAADFYSSRYDNFDVQPLLENDRILLSYTKCFLDQGPCTPDAKDFKKVIPEALETTCGKCTPKQKQLIKKVIKAVMERHPESWKQLEHKFDKDNKYQESFNKFLAEAD